MEKIFDGKKKAKLGTDKNPADVNVKTKKRLKEVTSLFEKHGWKWTTGSKDLYLFKDISNAEAEKEIKKLKIDESIIHFD